MRLKEIMTVDVESVRLGETLEHALALMGARGIHHLVVLDHRRAVGILTEDAIQLREAEGGTMVDDVMCRHIAIGSPDMTVRQAANLMRGRPDGALAVMDGERLVGIVTVSDLLNVLSRGVDRPASKERWTLRSRGVKPRAAVVGRRH